MILKHVVFSRILIKFDYFKLYHEDIRYVPEINVFKAHQVIQNKPNSNEKGKFKLVTKLKVRNG